MPPALRCAWPGDDPLLRAYHDQEWGVPTTAEPALFAALSLESAQAGLSWRTILQRRDAYRRSFFNWDLAQIAELTGDDVEALLQHQEPDGIIRHLAKIEAVITNANAVLRLHQQGLSLAEITYAYAGGDARSLARELKRRGFRFLGPTTCFSYLEAVGAVNGHERGCFRFPVIAALRDNLLRELTLPLT